MLTLKWRETAVDELDQIVTYIGTVHFDAAQRIKVLAQDCAQRICQHPEIYRAGRLQGTREAVFHPNYILVYRFDGDAVEVLNVLHTRRQYPPA